MAYITEQAADLIKGFSVGYGEVKAFINLISEKSNDTGTFLYSVKQTLQATLGFMQAMFKEFNSFTDAFWAFSMGMSRAEYQDKMFEQRIKDGSDFAEDEYDKLIQVHDQKLAELRKVQAEANVAMSNIRGEAEASTPAMAGNGETLITLKQLEDVTEAYVRLKKERVEASKELARTTIEHGKAKRQFDLLKMDGNAEQRGNSSAALDETARAHRAATVEVNRLASEIAAYEQSIVNTSKAFGMNEAQIREGLLPTFDEFGTKIMVSQDQLMEMSRSSSIGLRETATEILNLQNQAEELSGIRISAANIIDSEFGEQVEDMLDQGLEPIEEFQQTLNGMTADLMAQTQEIMTEGAGTAEERYAKAAEVTNEFYDQQIASMEAILVAAQSSIAAQSEAGIIAAVQMAEVVDAILAGLNAQRASFLGSLKTGLTTIPGTGTDGGSGGGARASAAKRLKDMMEEANKEAAELSERLVNPFAYELPSAIDKAKERIDKLADKLSGGTWTQQMKELFNTLSTNAIVEEMIEMKEASRDIRRSLMGERAARREVYDEEVANIASMKEKLIAMGLWRVE